MAELSWRLGQCQIDSAGNEGYAKVREDCTITEKDPTRAVPRHNADLGRLLCCSEQKFLVYPSLQAVKWQPAADTEHQINIKGT